MKSKKCTAFLGKDRSFLENFEKNSMFNAVFVIQAGEADWWKKRGSLIGYSVMSPKDSVEREVSA
jgi:hypothetical protein